MSITLNSRTVVDLRFRTANGMPAAGAYCVQLLVDLQVQNWPDQAGPVPVVRFLDGPVTLGGGPNGLLLGYARPETSVPFRVHRHAHSTGFLYKLVLSPQVMEAVEAKRGGGGVVLLLKVQAEVVVGANVDAVVDEVRCDIVQSDWLRVLEASGYGRSLLFEVPVPTSLGEEGARVLALLEAAKRAFVEGRYPESVAACRSVLDGLSRCLGQEDDLRKAREAGGQGRRELTVAERELRLRSAAINYAHLAHHPVEMQPDCIYDRPGAQMMLGVTASLASAAFARATAFRQGG